MYNDHFCFLFKQFGYLYSKSAAWAHEPDLWPSRWVIYEIKNMGAGKRGLRQTWSDPEEVYCSVIALGQSQTTATAALNYLHTSSEQDKSQKIAEIGYERPSTMFGKVFTGTWFLLKYLTHSQYLSHLLHEHSFPSPCLIHFPKQTAHLISIIFQRSKPSRTKTGCTQCL